MKTYSLLCIRKIEYPVLKQWFKKYNVPYEPSYYNSTLTHVSYTCTEQLHNQLLYFTIGRFGW